MKIDGIAFETYSQISLKGVWVPYFLKYEDGSLDPVERTLFGEIRHLPGWDEMNEADRLFSLAKFLEEPGEEILYQLVMETAKIPERKAS